MSKDKLRVHVAVIIKLGIRKVGKARELAAKIDHACERIRAQTGENLAVEYFKRPWKSEMSLSVEGNPKTVRLFLSEIRMHIETMGLRTIPENFHEI